MTESHNTFCYVAIGAELVTHAVDDELLSLRHVDAVKAPEPIQYAWAHPSLPILYVAYSNRSTADNHHGIATFQVDRRTGRLQGLGDPIILGNRPIHLSSDPTGRHLLVAYNQPSTLTVHRLNPDGSIGDTVEQGETVDAGIYAHQVRTSPSGDLVVLSTRGNTAGPRRSEDPGALKVFAFADGQLSNEVSIAPGGGIGFGPRHVDFHPTRPWMYAALERSNEVMTFEIRPDGIGQAPLYTKPTVDRPDRRAPQQYAGPIHVHPSGTHLYVANRSDGVVDVGGRAVHSQGENSLAVFSIDSMSGEPVLIQTIDARGFHPRTFAIHPDGRMLVAAAVKPLAQWDGDCISDVPAGLSVFRIGDDGMLTFVRRYDIDAGSHLVFWCGVVTW